MPTLFLDKLRQALPGKSPGAHPCNPPPKPKPGYRRGTSLAAVAEETIEVLPVIMRELPHLDATLSKKYDLNDMQPLKPANCPRHQLAQNEVDSSNTHRCGTKISVRNIDSFDAALDMMVTASACQSQNVTSRSASSTVTTNRVAVLNLASDKNPGGGWLHGAAAQEEALCFRSSLTMSLHGHYYPWTPKMGIYTRDVVIIRNAMDNGHDLLHPTIPAQEFPVVSVISVAGLRSPPLSDDRLEFRDAEDRNMTKEKMRLVLRIAAMEAHENLVLGAIGCGAFANPVRDVARCWLEVLKEAEFQGGWWRRVEFAVYDSRGEGNCNVFRRVLDGQIV